MGGKGNAKGTKAAGKGKSTYTGGNRGGGVTKRLTDILDGSSDDSDEDSLLSLIVGDDGKVEGATRKLALAAFLKKKDGGTVAAPGPRKLRSPQPNSPRSKR